jgi:hypothetical protein
MADDPVRQLDLIRAIAKRPATYELAPGRCLTGVASPPPGLAGEMVRDLIEPLRAADPRHHFYDAPSLHLTLKNVCSVRQPRGFGEGDARKALAALRRAAEQFPPLEFELRPPVLVGGSVWIPALTRSPLWAFNRAADDELRAEGLDDDKAYYSTEVRFGNLTVCRLTAPPSVEFANAIESLRGFARAHWTVNSGELIGCDIVCSPGSQRLYGRFDFLGEETTCATLPS